MAASSRHVLGSSTAFFCKKIKSRGADHLSSDSISPRSRSPIEAAQAQHRRQRLLPVTGRFILDALTQGVKLLLRNPVNLGGDFHDGHGEKLCRKAQMQIVRDVDMLLERACHCLQLGGGGVFHLAHSQRCAGALPGNPLACRRYFTEQRDQLDHGLMH